MTTAQGELYEQRLLRLLDHSADDGMSEPDIFFILGGAYGTFRAAVNRLCSRSVITQVEPYTGGLIRWRIKP